MPVKHQVETQSITVFDSGDPSVGIPAVYWELKGTMIFEEPEYLEQFKKDLINLLGQHDQIQGRASALTDWELEAMQEEIYNP